MTLQGTGAAKYAGNINQGSSTLNLIKSGSGVWGLSGTNTYSGTTYLADNSGPLVFQGLQALPAGTAITMRQLSSGTSHLWLLDDRSGTITLPNVLTLDHGNAVLGMTIFVGNNSTNNGGTSYSTQTGTTIALGKLNLLNSGANLSGFAAIYSANSYRLQFNAVDLPAFTSGSGAWTAYIHPTSAYVTLAGTIRQNSGSTVSRAPILHLGGSLASNLVSATIQDAADYPSNANAQPLSLIKSGASEWTLSGTNTYSGATAIQSGLVSINSLANVGGGASALGAPTTVANGTIPLGNTTTAATLRYTGTGHTSDRVINLAGTTGGATLEQAGTGLWKLTGNFTATGGGKKTLILDGATAAVGEIAGVIEDNSLVNTTSVTKVGSGTWILSGANTYRGATIVSNGTLLIHGSVTGAVTAVTGGALGGIGTVGNLAINNGATLTPGASVGTLSVSNLTLSGTYRAELQAGSGDQVVAAGAVNLTGASLSVTNFGSVTGTYVIVNKTSSGGITETFAGWPEGASVTVNGVDYTITYHGGDGNDVALTIAFSAPFTQWQIDNFGSSNAPEAAPLADPEGDGVVNLLEYAFDRDPWQVETVPLVTGVVERHLADGQEYLVLTFTRRKDDGDLHYTPQVSGNLGAWNSGPLHSELISQIDLSATNEEVRYRLKGPLSQTPRQYGRVTVALSGANAAAAVFAAHRLVLVPAQNYLAVPVGLTAHTLGALLATNRVAAGDTEANATVVDLWNQAGQTMGVRYFNSRAPGYLGWRQAGTFADANQLALDANKGFILTVRPEAGSATNYIVGLLPRASQTQVIQNNGYTLAGSRFPVPVAPSQANLVGSGFVGGSSLVTSDNVMLFNPVTQQFDIKLWFDSAGGVWRDQNGAVATQQLEPGTGFLIRRRNRAAGNFTWTNPVPYNVSEVWP